MEIFGIDIVADVVLTDGEPAMHHVVLRVDVEGRSDLYQLLIGVREGLPERLDHALIGEVEGRHAYDAVYDTELTSILIEAIAEDRTIGGLHFAPEPGAPIDPTQTSRVPSAEQSNTSLIYGDHAILKLFRRVGHGLNPDLELHRALAAVGSPHIAPPYGAIEGELDGQPVTYGMLQDYIANAGDGWQMATTSVRDLFAEGDLHAEEVGGDFAGESSRLGRATAEVHLALADALGARQAGPEESRDTAQLMRERLAAALAVVPDLLPYADRIREIYAEVTTLTEPVTVHRIHGDYHLGQVLRGLTGWVVLDFEGEPARPLSERVMPMSPLRDVAGMLRSFDYAARHLLADHSTEHGGEQQLNYRANEWAERNRTAFCEGYAEAAGDDPRKHETLLRAFELDKAVYEVVYEAGHRPTWLPIPLGSIARLTG
jgi:maltokinase